MRPKTKQSEDIQWQVEPAPNFTAKGLRSQQELSEKNNLQNAI